MKKLQITALILASAFVLSGCINKTEDTSVFSESKESNASLEVSEPNPSEATEEETMTNEEQPQANQIVTLKTNRGDIKIELFLKDMPITAGNFLKLAKNDFYDGVTFHRVIPDFMIQGGDPLSKDDNPSNDGTGGPGYFIQDEFGAGLSNERGTMAMANAGPNTGGSQFFINLVNNDFLDAKHPVFGKVISGMDVADKIVAVERDANDRPIDNVAIEDVVIE